MKARGRTCPSNVLDYLPIDRSEFAMNVPLFAFYVGPDQVVPAMSVLATVLGFIMIFWNKVMTLFRKVFGLKPPDPAVPDPESGDGSEPPKQS